MKEGGRVGWRILESWLGWVAWGISRENQPDCKPEWKELSSGSDLSSTGCHGDPQDLPALLPREPALPDRYLPMLNPMDRRA